jgi:hypothetical protein
MKIIHTPLLFWSAGFTLAPSLIFINPKYSFDVGLIEHEKVHAKQMQDIGALTFWWRYLTSKTCRQAFEVEAYQKQMRYGLSLERAAQYLVTMYSLNITLDEAKQLLTE